MHFVVIASPRTGSTHLTSLLNLRDDILCNGEVLDSKHNRLLVRWPKEEKTAERKRELIALRERDPAEFLRQVLQQDFGRQHVGFKILSKQNDELLDRIIEDRSVKKVILFRQNVLAVYSSARIAHETGKRHKEAKVDHPIIEFHENKFRKYHGRYLAFYRGIFEKLNDSCQHFHMVHYEGINDPALFDNLLGFLGAKRGVSSGMGTNAKRNTPDILARFSNPETVVEFLSKNGFTAWSHEAEISFRPVPRLRKRRHAKVATTAAAA